MATALQIANYLIKEYENITGTSINKSELMLQKLMYYAQKTAFAYTGKPLFDEDFEGWKHGPVLPILRGYFMDDLKEEYNEKLSDEVKYIIDNTIYSYGKYAAWTLRDLTHNEQAWINSRKGLNTGEHGYKIIKKEDIKEDSKDMRLYDYQFDMYIDEFEDLGDNFESIK